MFNMLLDASKGGEWYDVIVNAVNKIIGPILIVFCSIGVIYAVVIGVKMMKAESKEDRENNKARLINIAITIVAVVCMIAIFYALQAFLKKDTDITTIKNFVDTSAASSARLFFR